MKADRVHEIPRYYGSVGTMALKASQFRPAFNGGSPADPAAPLALSQPLYLIQVTPAASRFGARRTQRRRTHGAYNHRFPKFKFSFKLSIALYPHPPSLSLLYI